MPRQVNLSDPQVHARITSIIELNRWNAQQLINLFTLPYEQRSAVSAQNIKISVEQVASALLEIEDVLDGTIQI